MSRKSDISISINDYFKTYDLKDSFFINIDLQTKGNKLNLDVDYEVKVHRKMITR